MNSLRLPVFATLRLKRSTTRSIPSFSIASESETLSQLLLSSSCSWDWQKFSALVDSSFREMTQRREVAETQRGNRLACCHHLIRRPLLITAEVTEGRIVNVKQLSQLFPANQPERASVRFLDPCYAPHLQPNTPPEPAYSFHSPTLYSNQKCTTVVPTVSFFWHVANVIPSSTRSEPVSPRIYGCLNMLPASSFFGQATIA